MQNPTLARLIALLHRALQRILVTEVPVPQPVRIGSGVPTPRRD